MDVGDITLRPMRVLGEGGFGRVFLCQNRHGLGDNRLVCVKRIIVRNPIKEMKMIEEEIYIISQLKHPNIVRFLRWYKHHDTVNIVMEYASHGTLRDQISKHWHGRIYAMPSDDILCSFCDMLMGLEHLHIRHVMHRDLKPENLLVGRRGRIKIADFGISAIHNPHKRQHSSGGTPHYMAPEVMRGGECEFKSDIWSLGCVLYEMCTGERPFRQGRDREGLRALMAALAHRRFDAHCVAARVGDMWAQLVVRMICYNSKERIALHEIPRANQLLTKVFYRQYFDYE